MNNTDNQDRRTIDIIQSQLLIQPQQEQQNGSESYKLEKAWMILALGNAQQKSQAMPNGDVGKL